MPNQNKPRNPGFPGKTKTPQGSTQPFGGRGKSFAPRADQRPAQSRPAQKKSPAGRADYTPSSGYSRNTDRGYEESTRNNRQYDRPGRRDAAPSPFEGQRNRANRTGFTRPAQGNPGALRFGPGSRPQGKGFGRPAPGPMPAPRPGRDVQRPEQVGQNQMPEIHEEDLPQVNLLTGRNPIREAIKTGRDLEKLMIAKGELSGSAREIVSLAKKAGIMIQSVERSRLDQLAKNHQGMIAFASAYKYANVEEILDHAKALGEDPFIIVLDQVTDPHNLGAVIRTASCAGAHGVIVPLHRAVGLTPAAVKASAGAVEHIKVARVTNLSQTIKTLQKQGVWFYAAQTEGEDYRATTFSGPCALVIGSEGEGVSQLVADSCDKQVQIPMRGEMNSLNASVAAAILMYAVYGQRNPVKP